MDKIANVKAQLRLQNREQFDLDPFSKSLFMFCDKRRDRIKCLLWEGDGFVLLYRRLKNGRFRWPRNENEVRTIK